MADTTRMIRQSDAISKRPGPHVLARKPPASDFLPQVRDQIIYRFKRRGQEPKVIAGELTKRSGVRVQVRHINEVLRSAIPDRPQPPAPAVVPINGRRAA